MSYAARLAAMSRGTQRTPPRARPADSEPPREELAETEAVAPIRATPPTRSSEPAAPQPIAPPPRPGRPRMPVRQAEAATTTPTRLPPSPPAEHDIVEREIVAHERAMSRSPSHPEAAPVAPAIVERAVLPPQAQWLADDPAASDPLVASADSDALRELMRSVRRWTTSPPTPVPDPAVAPEQPAQPAPVPAAAPEPTQVSIGNVVITVEDAPPSPSRRDTPAAVRTTSDRMARNHIRGG